MSKVQIILASYCGQAYLREQLDSLLALDNPDWNLLICDDGSADATLAIIEEYQKKAPDKIRLHKNPKNLGVTKNFLSGLMECVKENQADYYMFCDQDDIWFPDRLDVMEKRMNRMEHVYGELCPLLVFTDAVVTDETLHVLAASYHRNQKLDMRNSKRDLAHLLMENKCSGCMMFMNRALAEKIKKIPEYARYHDWWIALTAAAFGHISYVGKPTMFYRQHRDNLVGSRNWFAYLKDVLSDLDRQKQSLLLSQRQAKEFFSIYRRELTPARRRIVREFAGLSRRSWLDRRILVFRFRFFKSNFLRNVGILLLI